MVYCAALPPCHGEEARLERRVNNLGADKRRHQAVQIDGRLVIWMVPLISALDHDVVMSMEQSGWQCGQRRRMAALPCACAPLLGSKSRH